MLLQILLVVIDRALSSLGATFWFLKYVVDGKKSNTSEGQQDNLIFLISF